MNDLFTNCVSANSPQLDQLLQDILSEDHLPERQWVWASEGTSPGRLVVWSGELTGCGYIVVTHSETDAPRQAFDKSGHPHTATPIKLSMESAMMQAAEQGPDCMGYACRGIVIMPEQQIIEVEGKPEGRPNNDKGFI